MATFAVFQDNSVKNNSAPTKLKIMFDGLGKQQARALENKNDENRNPNKNRNAVAPCKTFPKKTCTRKSKSQNAPTSNKPRPRTKPAPKSETKLTTSSTSIYKNIELNSKKTFQSYQDSIVLNAEETKQIVQVYQDTDGPNATHPPPLKCRSDYEWGWEADKENITKEEIFGEPLHNLSCWSPCQSNKHNSTPQLQKHNALVDFLKPSPNSLVFSDKPAIRVGQLDCIFSQMQDGTCSFPKPCKDNVDGQSSIKQSDDFVDRACCSVINSELKLDSSEQVGTMPSLSQLGQLHLRTMRLPEV